MGRDFRCSPKSQAPSTADSPRFGEMKKGRQRTGPYGSRLALTSLDNGQFLRGRRREQMMEMHPILRNFLGGGFLF